MRRIVILCLLCSVGFADRLVELASTQYVGSPVGIAAIAVPDGYLPTITSQREANRAHWRSMTIGLASPDETKFDGVLLGMDRHGGSALLAIRQRDEIKAVAYGYDVRAVRAEEIGSFDAAGLGNVRLLRIASLREGPMFVLAHDGGVTFAVVKPRGRGRADAVAGLGDAIAATHPFTVGRDARLSIFVVAPGRIVQLTQAGETFAFAAQQAFAAPGFTPRAIAGDGKELWVAGDAGGRATLLRFDARTLATAPVAMDLGAGVAEKLAFLSPNEIAVGGSRDSRAWVGVVTIGQRPAVTSEAFVKGTSLAAMGTNPDRKGWTVCTASPDGGVTVLRLPQDMAMPRGWDPFTASPQPVPEPEPVPGPGPGVGGGQGPGGGIGGGGGPVVGAPPPVAGGANGFACAVLPRAQAARGGAVDTEIVLINLGANPQQLIVRFVPDAGRGSFARVTVEPGKRMRVSAAESIFNNRRWAANDFDGYVRIDGGDRNTLVVDAVVRRQGESPEEVRPHWR